MTTIPACANRLEYEGECGMKGKSLRDLLGQKKSREDLNPEQQSKFDELRRQSERYRGMGDGQLQSEIDRLAQDPSVRDRIHSGDLDQFTQIIGPMLNPQQKEKLKQITQWLGDK